jgi:integrase
LGGKSELITPWVFLNPETSLPYHPRILSWWVPQIALVAGIPPIQPKDMRATCATNLLEEGVPLPRISQLLGHSSVAVTSSFYSRVLTRRDARIAQDADALDDALDRSALNARGERPPLLEEERRKRV